MEEKLMKRAIAIVVASFGLAALTANAQNAPTSTTPAPAASPTDFPGLGEVMTLQQLRHIKLWFAGHAGNWALANYEIGELNEGFEDADKLVGGGTVEKMVGTPIKALQKAVDDKNATEFTAAFDALSNGCNSCHHLLAHPFIVIQRPTLLPYSDQVFAPPKQ
jgi:hypothetical protein